MLLFIIYIVVISSILVFLDQIIHIGCTTVVPGNVGPGVVEIILVYEEFRGLNKRPYG